MKINITDKTKKEIDAIINDLILKTNSKEIYIKRIDNKTTLRWRL